VSFSDTFQEMPIGSGIGHGHRAPLLGFTWATNPITIHSIESLKTFIECPTQQESGLRPTA